MFARGFGWDGEVPGAMAYLACSYRIRLTDPFKDPLPYAKCRIADAPDTVYTCDEYGIAEIPIEDHSLATLSLEWESADAESGDPGDRFPWSNTFDVGVRSADDEACVKRLTHLGYTGATLADQVMAYQTHFGLEPTGEINDIRDALMDWHEGGTYPGQPEADDSGAPASPGKGDPVGYSIRLTDPHGNPIPNTAWSGEGADGATRNGTADGEGWAEFTVPDTLEWIDLAWEDPNGKQGESYRNKIHLRIGDGDAGVPLMLANLGYLGSTREEQIADFRNDFGYPPNVQDEKVLSDMTAWHDGGDMPPDGHAASNQGQA
ncbi:MAG: hypothetical protein JF616_06535 [Fibrobacteres bacterium]|nr:hypothetical protein [Fibrobacterota bacterium]